VRFAAVGDVGVECGVKVAEVCRDRSEIRVHLFAVGRSYVDRRGRQIAHSSGPSGSAAEQFAQTFAAECPAAL
jgi:hypothetical protein